MKTLLLLCVSALLFTGCASQVWYQPGKTPAEAMRDLGDCQMQAAHNTDPYGISAFAGLGGVIVRGANVDNFVASCMLSKGYQPVSARSVTNAAAWPKK